MAYEIGFHIGRMVTVGKKRPFVLGQRGGQSITISRGKGPLRVANSSHYEFAIGRGQGAQRHALGYKAGLHVTVGKRQLKLGSNPHVMFTARMSKSKAASIAAKARWHGKRK